MMRIEPFLLITLHFSHIGFTEDLTFISCLLSILLRRKKCDTKLPFEKGAIYIISRLLLNNKFYFNFQIIIFLLIAPDNPALVKVVGRQLDRHLVTRQNSDEIHAKLAADMRKNHMLILQFHFEHGVRELFQYCPFYLDSIRFRN